MSNSLPSTPLLMKNLPGLLLLLLLASIPVRAGAEVSIVATIRPLQLIAEAIVQDLGSVTAVVSGQQSPHNFTLSPSDRRLLADADLLLWIGAEFETYLADFYAQSSRAAITLTALQLPQLTLHAAAPGQVDAHLWLDSGNAVIIAAAVTARLVDLDATNAAAYQQNLAQFRRSADKLNTSIKGLFQRSTGNTYIVYHNAYQYFEKQFGLRHQFALLADPETEPGIRATLNGRRQIKQNRPGCLLREATSSQAVIDNMLNGYELKTVTVDLLGEEVLRAGTYIELINNVAVDFSNCMN
jgi:zinc transport system substrate-binding protein